MAAGGRSFEPSAGKAEVRLGHVSMSLGFAQDLRACVATASSSSRWGLI
jgi:hypothetical protein